MSRKRTNVLIVLGICVLGVATGLVVAAHHGSSPSSTQNHVADSKTVRLHGQVTAVFPCATHEVELASSTATQVHAYGGDCVSTQAGTTKGFMYATVFEQYPASGPAHAADASYCTAHNSYPSATKDHTIYVLNATTTKASGQDFSTCVLSADQTNGYEAMAQALRGGNVIAVQIGAPNVADPAVLQSAMQAFLATLHF